MKKITNELCIHLLKEKFPKFLPYWDSYINDWGQDQGITIQMMPFAEYTTDVIKLNDANEIKKIFDFVELLLDQGDDSVQNAITTSFLEDLLSKDPEEIRFSRFSQYLGKNTVDYCKAWNQFTGIQTEGLWENG